MNLSLKEIEILQALKGQYPKPSSVKQLVEVTQRERSVIKNTLVGLRALTLVSVTDKNEVYLLKSGKEYLGIDYTDIKPFVPELTEAIPVVKTNTLTLASSTPSKEAQSNQSLEKAFTELESKLNTKPLEIEELGLKLNVLKRLSVLLSDDIAEVLTSISDDLMGASDEGEAA